MNKEEVQNAIRGARREIDAEMGRRDFWYGYIAAMEEVSRSIGPEPEPEDRFTQDRKAAGV